MDISSNKTPITNAIPIIIDNPRIISETNNNNNDNDNNDNDNSIFDVYIRTDMKFAYGSSNFIKLLCSIKLFFCFLSTMFQSYTYMYSFILPIVGYIGAKKYNNCFNYLHIFLTFLNSINTITFMVYFYTSPIYQNNAIYGFISILDIIVCLWIIRIVYIFSTYIKKLTEEEILFLKIYKEYDAVIW